MELRCHACGQTVVVPLGALATTCTHCGAAITLTALETRAAKRSRDGEPAEALLGEVLAGYRLSSVLGGGGMGVVYEAERTETATFAGPERAAIKVLAQAFSADTEFIERFRREADALTRLRHPNLIEVYEKGELRREGKVPLYFFIMERFLGEDLRSVIARGAVDPATSAAIIRGAAEGLAFAHSHGIVHRDVKPANILVSGDPARGGNVKVVDFGVAQLATGQYTLTSLTRSELVLGTINYMSPEQRVDASAIDHRADVYALGVVAYELLTGKLPIGVFEPPSTLAQLPRAIDRVVLSALRREPAQRPDDARMFAEQFARTLVPASRQRGLVLAVAAGLVLVAGAVATREATSSDPAPAKVQAQMKVEEKAEGPPPYVISDGVRTLVDSMRENGAIAIERSVAPLEIEKPVESKKTAKRKKPMFKK